MKFLLIILLFLSSIYASKNTITLSEEERDWLLKNPIVQIADLKGTNKFIFTDANGKLYGFHVDLLKFINKNLNTHMVIKLYDSWNSAYSDAKDGKVDAIFRLSYLKSREKYFHYSPAYFYTKTKITTRKDEKKINSIQDLNGKTFVTQKNNIANNILKNEAPDAKIIHRKDIKEILKAIQDKKADATFQTNINSDILDAMGLQINNTIHTKYGQFAIGTTKNKPILASIIKKGVLSLSKQQREKLKEKWLPNNDKKTFNIAFGKGRGLYATDEKFIKGVEYDLVKLIFDRLGVSFNFSKTLTLDAMQNVLKNNSYIDVAVTVKKRKNIFYYSDDFISFGSVAISRKTDNFFIDKVEDLKNKKVIAFINAYKFLGDPYYKAFNPKNRSKRYKEENFQIKQIEDFLDKKADVLILDKNIFEWYLKKISFTSLNEYNFDHIFPGKNPYKVAFRDKNLRNNFNKELKKIKESGEYYQILDNYLIHNIEAKSKVATFFSAIVSKSIFENDMDNLKKIANIFENIGFIEKIEIFNINKELLYRTNKNTYNNKISKNSFFLFTDIPQKVAKINIYFNKTKLDIFSQNNHLIPDLKDFAGLNDFFYIKSIYKSFDVLEEELKFTQKEKNYIKNHKSVRIAGIERAPLFYKDQKNNDFQGIYIDIIDLISKKSGIKFEYRVAKDWEDSFNQLFNDASLIMGNSIMSDYRLDTLASNGFMNFELAIVANKNLSFIPSIKELDTKTLALANPSPAYELIADKYSNLNLNIIETKTSKEAMSLVLKNKADVVLVNDIFLTSLFKNEFSDLKVVGLSSENLKLNFIMNSLEPELLSIINKVLKSISYSQQQNIKDRWVSTKINTTIDYSIVYKVAGILLFVILIIFLINRRLKRIVENKTHKLNHLVDVYDKNIIATKIDKAGVIIYVSSAFCEKFEFSQNELIGQKINSCFYKNINKKQLIQIRKAFLTKQCWDGEIVTKSKFEKTFWTKIKMFPEYDEKQNFLDFTFILDDITAQIEVKNLNKEILTTQKEIIFKMGAIGEARSQETGQHVKRVAKYSKLFAFYYGLDSEEIKIIELASPMHDIGKVAIADSILNKRGKLTKEEFELIKSHSQLGYDMLKGSTRTILKTAAIIAYEHHEKYDGTGYPRGLKGEGIHIYGRITAIADVFDALGSERIYKDAWDDAKIFEFFVEQRGKHFDPKLVDIFFDNLSTFLAIRNKFKDI